MPAESIDEVIAELDRIIDLARAEESRLGYFRALYRRLGEPLTWRVSRSTLFPGRQPQKGGSMNPPDHQQPSKSSLQEVEDSGGS